MQLALAVLALSFLSQTIPSDMDITQPPQNAHLAFTAQGKGVQIYTCTAQGVYSNWVLKAPAATLADAQGNQIGTHSAGPTWTATDGSSIVGKVLTKKVSYDPLSVDWLLLAATPAPGHPGVFSKIAFVRRSDTHGGQPPADGCDAAHPNAEARVPYTATYSFYR